ncbi:MAG: hypothetical protein DWQ04_10200 [Chloroflexi bacterium]|nr:MAG: hypothetical protein DWQ04_10200 [Chloroflexota bacterium]
MESRNKLKSQLFIHSTYKTKEDFLRWLKEQKARKKQIQEEQLAQDIHAMSLALMVWADDGGETS